MRRAFLLMALCLAGALVFAPAAMAQDGDLDCGQLSEAEEQAVFAADPSDPNSLDADDDGVPCEDDTTDDGSFVAPTEEQYGPTVTQYGPTVTQYEPTATQYGGGGTTATPAATAATGGALPGTGGAPVLALGVGVLLAIGGLLARRIVH